jgi:hypothetical protein
MSEQIEPRKTACATCPYRCNVPSGIWDPEEYDKLVRYDGDTSSQPMAVFRCHQGDGSICAGWFRHRDPADLLAVRMAVITGSLDPAFVEAWHPHQAEGVFRSGEAAAEHGKREVRVPNPQARAAIAKIIRKRNLDA